MDDLLKKLAVMFLAGACASCSLVAPSQASFQVPDKMTRQIVRERISAVVVTERKELGSWVNHKFAIANAPQDADGGSAAPISEDGYFLTADHVLAGAPHKNIFIIYANGGKITTARARVVWRSAADDLALLHISKKTPYYFQWSSPSRRITAGLPIIHGGMATGFKSSHGALKSSLGSESLLTRSRTFKMDIPLEPGDSGGPVIDAYGNLIGVNSAVEFLIPLETAIFIDSEGVRPNVQKINELIQRDRNSNPASNR
jgi:S1-C subfamily serine protease